MRLSFIILAAAVALAGLLDASSTATAVTIAKQGEGNAVAFDPRSVGNNHRSLRLRNADLDDLDNLDDEDDLDDKNDLDDLDDSADFDVDDSKEERGGFSLGGLGTTFSKMASDMADKAAVALIAAKFFGKEADEMGDVIKSLTKTEILTLFDKGETQLQKLLPGFETGMNLNRFDNLISGMPSDQQAVMSSAYTKYLHYKG